MRLKEGQFLPVGSPENALLNGNGDCIDKLEQQDDDDANADLSLGVVAKAKSQRLSGSNPTPPALPLHLVFTSDEEDERSDKKDSFAPLKVLDVEGKISRGHGAADENPNPSLNGSERIRINPQGNDHSRVIVMRENGETTSGKEGSWKKAARKQRGHRYFETPENNKEDNYIKPCYVCGDLEHEGRDCVKAMQCFLCNRTGHALKNCPTKNSRGELRTDKSLLCLLCGLRGHVMTSCRNGYKPEDLKEVQCYVCKQFGHLCCIDIIDDCTREISCYNCGEGGHLGEGCGKSRSGRHFFRTCFTCGEAGHVSRGCGRSKRRVPKESSSAYKDAEKDGSFDGFKSVPRDFGKSHQRLDSGDKKREGESAGNFKSEKRRIVNNGGLPGWGSNTAILPGKRRKFGDCKSGRSNELSTVKKIGECKSVCSNEPSTGHKKIEDFQSGSSNEPSTGQKKLGDCKSGSSNEPSLLSTGQTKIRDFQSGSSNEPSTGQKNIGDCKSGRSNEPSTGQKKIRDFQSGSSNDPSTRQKRKKLQPGKPQRERSPSSKLKLLQKTLETYLNRPASAEEKDASSSEPSTGQNKIGNGKSGSSNEPSTGQKNIGDIEPSTQRKRQRHGHRLGKHTMKRLRMSSPSSRDELLQEILV